jgi:G:T-mismatch repair DNA endonuclease (very short patch repair protein)
MPNGRLRNPDFVWLERKKIIEVFGRYWHRNDNEQEIVKAYADVGWSCLILWDDELDASVRDRILMFAYPHEYDAEMQELNECLPFA